ncbi:hypothetical protein D3C72_2022020 [compost metagenome]
MFNAASETIDGAPARVGAGAVAAAGAAAAATGWAELRVTVAWAAERAEVTSVIFMVVPHAKRG